MPHFASMILWTVITTLIGFNLLALFDRQRLVKGAEVFGLSFLLGLGAVSFQMFVMGIAGLPLQKYYILCPWIFLTVFNMFVTRAFAVERFRFALRGLSGFEKVIVSLISFQVAYTFFRALIRPLEAYDSVAIYGLKSKIIYLAGTVPADFFDFVMKHFQGAHPDYPLLLSMSETWVYVFMNSFNDFLVKWIFPLAYLGFLIVFYAVLKRIIQSRKEALVFTFMIASVAQFSNYATIGYADMLLGVYFCLAFSFLYLWFMKNKHISYLWLSLLFSLLTVWTKNEGMLLALIIVFITGVFVFKGRTRISAKETGAALFYMILICSAVFAWIMFVRSRGLVNENFNLSMVSPGQMLSGIRRIPAILYEYQKHLFGFKKWNITWLIMAVLFVIGFKKVYKGNIAYATTVILLFFITYGIVCIYSVVDINFLLKKTASRFLIHILPVSVFWCAFMAKECGVGISDNHG